MNKFLAIISGILIAVGVAACGTPITHGVVTNKSYTPGHYVTNWIPQYIQHCSTVRSSSGHYSISCHSDYTGSLPVRSYDPPEWQLEVKQSSKIEGWVDVTQAIFNKMRLGSHWHQT